MILSLVTINFNNKNGLNKTLLGINAQTNKEFEHIIVDGGSMDGSVDIIRKYADESAYTVRWLSEIDNGIYNAMNKGIHMANGDYIQILNSGDCFVSNDVVEKMMKELEYHGFPDILYGNMIKVDDKGRIVGKSGLIEYTLRQFYYGTLNHDCAWIKRDLFNEERYGLYDENLEIVSDWKWYLQAIGLGKVKPVYVDIDMTLFDTGGVSERNLEFRNKERRKVLEEVLPPAVLEDYDNHEFETRQVDRIRKYHLYPVLYFVERVLFKLEKWKILK